jgi:hypothetical protein
MVEGLLRKTTDAILHHLEERTPNMNALKIKTKLRNAPRHLARLGLDLTIAWTASINGPGARAGAAFMPATKTIRG